MKRLSLYLLLGVLGVAAHAVEINIAPFVTVVETDAPDETSLSDFGQKLVSQLVALDPQALLTFRYRSEASSAIKSTLDAARASEQFGWESLLFGVVTRTSSSIDLELRVYSHPDRKVQRVFLLRSAPGDYEALVRDAATKVHDYFAVAYFVDKPEVNVRAEGNSWVSSHAASWWGALSPWSKLLQPVAGYRTTWQVRAGDPLWTNGEWLVQSELGLSASVAFALNAPSVIPSRYYDGSFGPHGGLAFVWQRQQEVFLSISPEAKFHYVSYQAQHAASNAVFITWYGGSLDLGYRFWVDSLRTWAVGLDAGVSGYLSDPLYFDYRLGVLLTWKGDLK